MSSHQRSGNGSRVRLVGCSRSSDGGGVSNFVGTCSPHVIQPQSAETQAEREAERGAEGARGSKTDRERKSAREREGESEREGERERERGGTCISAGVLFFAMYSLMSIGVG